MGSFPWFLAFFVGLRICEQRGLPRRGWQHQITSSPQVLRSIRAQITPKTPFPFLAFWKIMFFGTAPHGSERLRCLAGRQTFLFQYLLSVTMGFVKIVKQPWLWEASNASNFQLFRASLGCQVPRVWHLKMCEWKVSLSMVTSVSNSKKG